MADIATIIIAAMVAFIGYLQYLNNTKQKLIAQEKLKLDLFEKRFKVYLETIDVIHMATTDEPPDSQVMRNFGNRASEAIFLFDESIHDYLTDIYNIADAINNIKLKKDLAYVLRFLPDQFLKDKELTEESGVRAVEGQIVIWLHDRYRELPKVFTPYLKFKLLS